MYRLLVNTPRLGEDTGPPQDEVHPWGLAATQVRAGSRELLRHGIEDKWLIQAQIAPSKNTFWSFGEGGGQLKPRTQQRSSAQFCFEPCLPSQGSEVICAKTCVCLTDSEVQQRGGVGMQETERLLTSTGKQPESSPWADLHEM